MMNTIFMLINELLSLINSTVGDWGVTIIIVTIIIRLCLLPLSLRQKTNMQKQQVLSKKMEEIKEKYRNDKERLDAEMLGLSKESAKNMLGCLVTLVQMPVMFSLYRVFTSMPVEVGSAIVPWVANLNLPDMYFIIPIISAVVQLLPNILTAAGAIKSMNLPKTTAGQMVLTVVMNLIFLARAPVTIGIYWIATGLFSLVEQLVYNLYMSRKCLSQ